jgi:hypothetical protein
MLGCNPAPGGALFGAESAPAAEDSAEVATVALLLRGAGIPLTRWAVRHWPTTIAGNNDSEPPSPQLISVADAEQHS